MKKSVVGTVAIVLVAGVWLGTTWYTGTKLESESAERLALANEQLAQLDPESDLILSQVSFERGFFSSHARYALTVAEKGAEPELRLEFDNVYEHGPFPASALKQGQLLPQLAFVRSELANTADGQTWFELAKGKMPLLSEVLLSYSGNAKFDVRFAPLEMASEELSFMFAGADLNGTFTADKEHTQGVFRAPELNMITRTNASGLVKFSLKDSQLDFDSPKNAFGIQTGDAELRIAQLSVSEEDGFDLVVDKLAYGGSSTEDAQFMQGKAYLNTGSVSLNGQDFGSQSLVIKMDKIDGKAMKQFSDLYGQLMAQGENSDAFAGSDALMQAGMSLLAANPTLSLDDFSWTTPKGRSTLAVHSEWQAPADLQMPAALLASQAVKQINIDFNLNKPMAIDLLAKYLQGSEGLEAPEAQALAELQVDEALAGLGMFGLLKAEGDTVSSQVQYDGSSIIVNGQPLPTEALLGLMMAM